MSLAANRLHLVRGIQLGRIKELVHHLATQQVLLFQQEVQRVVFERRIGEPLVGSRRCRGSGRVTAHCPPRCCAYCRSQADGQSTVGGCGPRRVLYQRAARRDQ